MCLTENETAPNDLVKECSKVAFKLSTWLNSLKLHHKHSLCAPDSESCERKTQNQQYDPDFLRD